MKFENIKKALFGKHLDSKNLPMKITLQDGIRNTIFRG